MRPRVDATRPAALARVLPGFYASAAAMDGGFFLIMAAMPFKVLAVGGGALELGLVPAIGSLVYIVCAPLAGRWSDRLGRTQLCLGGGVVLIACALLAWLAQRLDLLLALQALMGLGKALYWPPVQATIGDLSPAGLRVAVLGRFNVAWSGGKALGFVAGGLLLVAGGFQITYLAGAVCVGVAFALLPKGRLVAAAAGEATAAARTAPGPADAPDDALTLRAFRAMGWTANTAAYAILGILTHHLPQWFAHRGWDAGRYGWFLGAILASQTAVFVLLAGPVRLVWSAWRLWSPQAFGVLAVAAVPVLPAFPWLLAVAPLIGLACGVSYAASIFYSLEIPADRGRNAGIHEGLVGAGGLLPPFLAGLLVRLGCGLAAPYLLAAALAAIALGVQVGLHVRRRRVV